MIQDFGGKGRSDPAFCAGLLLSSFTLCESLSSWVWAYVSGRIGRKPTLLIGAACGTLSALAFGFSESIGSALGARMFGGLTSPNVGVIQAFIGELVKIKTNQDLKDLLPTLPHRYRGPTDRDIGYVTS